MPTDSRSPLTRRPARLALGVAALTVLSASAPALADPTPDPLPVFAFLARSDVPFDALAAAPVAGATGGVVLLTTPDALAPAARQGLVDRAPDVVVIVGGTAAVDAATEAEVRAAVPADVQRVAGVDRHDTARVLAGLPAALGYERPVLTEAGAAFGAWARDYESRGHHHGVAPVAGTGEGGGVVHGALPAATTTAPRTLAEVTVPAEDVGDECPVLFTVHHLLVRASGTVAGADAGTAGAVDVVLERDDGTGPTADEDSRRSVRLDAGVTPDAVSFATETSYSVVETTTPQVFRVRVQSTAGSPDHEAAGTLVVEQRGFTCEP